MMTETLAEYLDARSIPEPNSGCHLWLLSLNSKGYANAKHNEPKITTAHRLAWAAANGPIPDGMLVCHKCDVRSCINPNHLWLGTDADNIADRDAKGRTSRGERHSATLGRQKRVLGGSK